ncbi:hypothetical protein M9458_054278 [Cirrhinus mrigala]|uniref:Gypsy retrotransposon integrase-like protein 1 n=1 Tax=Cirrhinus mrigala TaxID=683832 RepID=A0ABD0MNF8_CIRMR
MLATHQRQLNRLTTLTEELVKTLQVLHTPPAKPAISHPSLPTHTAVHSATTTSPRLAFPDKFDGTPAKCKGFLLQCLMFVNQQPTLCSTDNSRIAFVCSLLSSRALNWVTAVWSEDCVVFPSSAAFLQNFREVFEHSTNGKVGEQLLQLRQGKNTTADYALTFRTLAAQTGWPDDPLKLLFCKGLNAELQSELACWDKGRSLAQFIDLAICVNNLLRARRPQRLPTSYVSTSPPLQSTISSEEREQRIQKNLCLYCGLPGHMRSSCPTRPSRKTAAIQHTTDDLTLCSGALHTETIRLFILSASQTRIILGFPWLERHNPVISWTEKQILRWEYRDLTEAFSKAKASPPHRSTDCAIDLKKDGGLRPCIDYWGLNEITIKFRYPLPLVPAALEQLRTAKFFTKLDLRSAYNLIRIREVLQCLMQHQLYAKLEKCEFHKTKISFLDYIISPKGVAMDDSKVRAVVNWPQPTTIKELQRFLGFANFYRRFIHNFSSISAPLTSMIKGGRQRLSWTPSAITAFQELKNRFMTAHILHHPDPDLEFIVEVDGSNTDIGAVLSQRQGNPPKMYPCVFYSHKLTPTEQNYDVGHRELLAIKAAFEEWQHWLEGAKHPFTVLTDHHNLECLRSAKQLNHRQARWALFFTRFNFSVTYRPGSQNTKADALSCLHESHASPSTNEPILSPSIIVAPVQWKITIEISEAHLTDPPPAKCPPNRTYVPQILRQRLLQLVHSTPSSGHPGITATTQLLTNRYWWPSLQTDTISFVKDCSICNTSKSAHQLPAGLLQPLPIPRRPWSHIAIDFVTDLPPSSGYTTILTVIDRFSKACHLILLAKLPSALETAEALCNQAERLNQELTRFLRSYCQQNQSEWSRYLLWAEYAQNSLRKPSTNLTPFQCILGFQPPLFPWSGEPSELPAVDSWLRRSEETWDQAHVHLQRAVRRTREQADRHHRPSPAYHPGQWVWLSTRDLRLRLPSKKLSPRYVGPFKILKEIHLDWLYLEITVSHPHFMSLCLSPLVVREEWRTRRRLVTRVPLHSSSTARMPTRSTKSWIHVAGPEGSSTWWTGKGMVRISLPRDLVEGLGIVCLLASGAAHREGLCHEFSLCGSLRSPPEGTVTGVLVSFGLHYPQPRAWG